MLYKYGKEDIDVKKLDYSFINEFAFWLKAIRNCNQNSTTKYLSNFKKIVNFCIQSGFIVRNPFVGFKLVKKEVVREILSKEDLEKMASVQFPTERSDQVRDIYLFCCYPGLAYADIKKLKRTEIARSSMTERGWKNTTLKHVFMISKSGDGTFRIRLMFMPVLISPWVITRFR